jgi:hypothetical protein
MLLLPCPLRTRSPDSAVTSAAAAVSVVWPRAACHVDCLARILAGGHFHGQGRPGHTALPPQLLASARRAQA